ncbi:FecR family protein [Mariniphaga sediminis]|uniref:FecR family protein n=1 Tax=Mariniphaga sediminis TaxID=1628158 RepID=A0A399D1R8_9BACT|nr:FecR domain-containing protein [Mariniphaga sediminis]RIH64632.1 FecR family protein [Mariniphaga sediminis]
MEQKEIIEKIINNEPLYRSEELISWIRESEANRDEYIRYKNAWALLQQGREMSEKFIAEDFEAVKRKMKMPRRQFDFRQVMKYAAIIIFAIMSGYVLNSVVSSTGNQVVSMNEISVPYGNRSLIVLPDGSKAWLTNGSKISYPENFTGKTRDVTLTGEAFFTVAHNKEKPFFVNVGEHRVKVLGTEFSVVAYPDDDMVRVDLVSGKVQMDVKDQSGNYESYSLKPLHGLVLDKKSGNLKNNLKIPDGFFKYWQKGVYEFRDESFESLARKIERIYSVKIVFEDSHIGHNSFTGAFHIDSNIYTIIETFKRASRVPFDYSIEKDKIYIKHVN